MSKESNGQMDIPKAVKSACRYVGKGIATGPRLGHCNGPINHFHSLKMLPPSFLTPPRISIHGEQQEVAT